MQSRARRIFSPAVLSAAGSTPALASKLDSGELTDGFAVRDVYQNGWSRLSGREEASAAADVLVDLDWLAEGRERTAGRTQTVYWVNPKVRAGAGAGPKGASGRTAGTAGRPPAPPSGGSGGSPPLPVPPHADADGGFVLPPDAVTVEDVVAAGPPRERGRL